MVIELLNLIVKRQSSVSFMEKKSVDKCIPFSNSNNRDGAITNEDLLALYFQS